MSGTKWAISRTLVTADICEGLTVSIKQFMHLLTESPGDTNIIPIYSDEETERQGNHMRNEVTTFKVTQYLE